MTLPREYWIMIRSEAGTYSMFPRPDGNPYIVQECTARGPLATLFNDAKLCTPATPETIGRVNALTAEEARSTSTYLHQRLRFVASEGAGLEGSRVEPYPYTDALLAVCKGYPSDRAGSRAGHQQDHVPGSFRGFEEPVHAAASDGAPTRHAARTGDRRRSLMGSS